MRGTVRLMNFMQELHRALKTFPPNSVAGFWRGGYNFMQELHRALKKIRPIRHSGAERDFGVRSDVCLRHTCRREVAKVE